MYEIEHKIGAFVQTLTLSRYVDGKLVKEDEKYCWSSAKVVGYFYEKGPGRKPKVYTSQSGKQFVRLQLEFPFQKETKFVPCFGVRGQEKVDHDLAEDFKSVQEAHKVDLLNKILEQVTNNAQRIDAMSQRLQGLEARLDELEVVEERSPKSSDFRIEELREAVAADQDDFGIIAAAMAEAEVELPPLG